MSNLILLDINEHLHNKYPNLEPDQIDLIASDVKQRWDYRELIDSVDFKCKQTAYYANIELGDDSYMGGLEIKYEPMEHTSEGC